jgi:hypothetical protein
MMSAPAMDAMNKDSLPTSRKAIGNKVNGKKGRPVGVAAVVSPPQWIKSNNEKSLHAADAPAIAGKVANGKKVNMINRHKMNLVIAAAFRAAAQAVVDLRR